MGGNISSAGSGSCMVGRKRCQELSGIFSTSLGAHAMSSKFGIIGYGVYMYLVSSLLDCGAAFSVQDFRLTPVCDAIVSGKLDKAMKLVKAGADPNAGHGCALIASATRGQLQMVELLLDRGANPNRIVSGDLRIVMGGTTPLVAAVQSRKAEMVRLLLQRGANPRDDFEAFSIVLNFADVDMAELLLSHGANPNMTYPSGGEVYSYIELKPGYQQQVIVPRRDIEADRIDETAKRYKCRLSELFEGTSLLYLAAGQSGGPRGIGPSSVSLDPIVKLLIARGGNPNTKTLNGSTPLMHAASRNHLGIMRMLIDAGADVKATDRCGRTARDYAWSAEAKALLDSVTK